MFAAVTSGAPPPANEVSDVATVWKQIAETLEPFLEAVAVRLAAQADEFEPSLGPTAAYALNGQGKQLRPTLVGLCAEATGGVADDHVTAAVIVELVHLATLIHDDVMDEAQVRRGRPTVAANWGNEHAVLFGDCLFAHALKLAASYPTPDICRAVASATQVVCTGEILQNRQRLNFQITLPEYFRVLEMKTAALFALSCDLGACFNQPSPAHRKALQDFGLALGTAYQIYDDCLDLFGTETLAGKSLGTDLAKGKLTLPVLLFQQQASERERARLETLLRDWRPAGLGAVVALLQGHQALERSSEVFRVHLQRARGALLPLRGSEGRLAQLTDFLAGQMEGLGTAV
jgi:octaprenyl-diphosphate synthase